MGPCGSSICVDAACGEGTGCMRVNVIHNGQCDRDCDCWCVQVGCSVMRYTNYLFVLYILDTKEVQGRGAKQSSQAANNNILP